MKNRGIHPGFSCLSRLFGCGEKSVLFFVVHPLREAFALCLQPQGASNKPINPVGLAWLLALFSTLYTNPFTIVPLYLLAFTIGEWILGGGGHFTAPPEWSGSWSGASLLEWLETLAQWMLGLGRPLALGLIVLAATLSAAGYLVVRVAWRLYLIRAWRRRGTRQP